MAQRRRSRSRSRSPYLNPAGTARGRPRESSLPRRRDSTRKSPPRGGEGVSRRYSDRKKLSSPPRDSHRGKVTSRRSVSRSSSSGLQRGGGRYERREREREEKRKSSRGVETHHLRITQAAPPRKQIGRPPRIGGDDDAPQTSPYHANRSLATPLANNADGTPIGEVAHVVTPFQVVGRRRPPPLRRYQGAGGATFHPLNRTVDRATICPFLLRVFYRMNGYHDLSEFAVRGMEPVTDELQIYTWPDATLREVVDLIKDVLPEARDRSVRLEFRLIYPARNGRNQVADIGAVHSTRSSPEDRKTLSSARFEVGDFLDVGIFTHTSPRSQKLINNRGTGENPLQNTMTAENEDRAENDAPRSAREDEEEEEEGERGRQEDDEERRQTPTSEEKPQQEDTTTKDN